MGPAPRAVWGLEERAAPFGGSALAEYDYGYEEPAEATHADETDAHYRLPNEAPGLAQVAEFLERGEVTHHCDGVCDPQ